MKLSLFVYNSNVEETNQISNLLSEDFTVISFNNKERALQFISLYYNWFDAAILSKDSLNGEEITFINELSRQNPEIPCAIISNEESSRKKVFNTSLFPFTFLIRPIDVASINDFASRTKNRNPISVSHNLWN